MKFQPTCRIYRLTGSLLLSAGGVGRRFLYNGVELSPPFFPCSTSGSRFRCALMLKDLNPPLSPSEDFIRWRDLKRPSLYCLPREAIIAVRRFVFNSPFLITPSPSQSSPEHRPFAPFRGSLLFDILSGRVEFVDAHQFCFQSFFLSNYLSDAFEFQLLLVLS